MRQLVPKFVGNVGNDGKLTLQNPTAFLKHVSTFRGNTVELTVEKPKRKRSNQQNNYYWGVVVKMIADEMGMGESEEERESVHDDLRDMFAYRMVGNRKVRKSTTKFNTVEMEEYLANVRQWAATFFTPGLYIPLPNEAVYD